MNWLFLKIFCPARITKVLQIKTMQENKKTGSEYMFKVNPSLCLIVANNSPTEVIIKKLMNCCLITLYIIGQVASYLSRTDLSFSQVLQSFFVDSSGVTFAVNGLALGEEAGFDALNFLPAQNLIRRTKLHLSTEPAFLPNAC